MVDIFDSIKEKYITTEMASKGYAPNVITALLPYGSTALSDMNEIDDRTFGKNAANPGGKSPEQMALYNQAVTSIRGLGKTNVTFATEVADGYRQSRGNFVQKMNTFSNAMYEDPAVARKVIELAKAGNTNELKKLGNNPDGYMDALNAPKAVQPKADTTHTATVKQPAAHQTPTGKDSPTRQEQLARINKMANGQSTGPAKSKSETVEGSEVTYEGASDTRDLTSAEAQQRLTNMLADPKNALAKKIKEQPDLEKGLRARLDANPNMVRNFESKSNQSAYMGMLAQGNAAGFLNEFGVPPVADVPGMGNMGGIGNLLTDALNKIKGVAPGASGFLDGIIQGVEHGTSLVGRLFSSFNAPDAKSSGQGTYAQIERLLKSNDPAQVAYGQEIADRARQGLSGQNANNATYSASILSGFKLNDDQMQVLKQGGHHKIDVIVDPKNGDKRLSSTVTTAPTVRDAVLDRTVNEPDPRVMDDLRHERQRQMIEQPGLQPNGVQSFPID